MQPLGTLLVPSMLAAGDNGKIAPVRIFYRMNLCNQSQRFIYPISVTVLIAFLIV